MLCCFHGENNGGPGKRRNYRKEQCRQPVPSRGQQSLKVLELLQSARSSIPLHEIFKRLQLSKTSTFHLLRTLEAADCVVAAGAANAAWPREFLGLCLALALRLLRVATVRMQELNANLRETVSMAALFDNRIEVVAVIESPRPSA